MSELKEPFASRVAAHNRAHPERCWYWMAEPPYVPPCGRCTACQQRLPVTVTPLPGEHR
jgi:hypothetical protein